MREEQGLTVLLCPFGRNASYCFGRIRFPRFFISIQAKWIPRYILCSPSCPVESDLKGIRCVDMGAKKNGLSVRTKSWESIDRKFESPVELKFFEWNSNFPTISKLELIAKGPAYKSTASYTCHSNSQVDPRQPVAREIFAVIPHRNAWPTENSAIIMSAGSGFFVTSTSHCARKS